MDGPRLPASSYRLQFGSHFRFIDAERLVPYLDALGITTCYASPLLQAAVGSTHGYDVVDYNALNHELGSEAEFDAFIKALQERGMGLLLDFVPNHMGLDSSANLWWHDVLQHGRSSAFAGYFDIEWDPITPELNGRVLLPILEDAYGEVLERGEISLGYEAGAFHIQYFNRRIPLEPRSSLPVLRAVIPRGQRKNPEWRAYGDLLSAIEKMPSIDEARQDPARAASRREIAARAGEDLERIVDGSPGIRTALDRALAAFAGVPGNPATFDRLHDVLECQVYRLAHWKSAFDEINYRRFFDVNNLGALRMEDPRVFAAAHARVIQWVTDDRITGLRIDHADGLLDPAAYFAALARATSTARPAPFYIVAEKILAHGELLPESWPIAGTTGYGFLNAVNGLFVDAGNEEEFRRVYADATGSDDSVAEVAYQSKRLVMSSSLASEVTVLATRLKAIAGADRRTRDFTLTTLRRAIIEVIACLPVYRTYLNGEGVSATDRHVIDLAIDRASRRNPVIVGSAFLFLRRVLLAEGTAGDPRSDAFRQFAMKFQQLSAPVQAKGVEDTCFYRYNALLSLNEVGGEPQRFGTSVEDFHDANRVRQERWPREMTATATHDTKRGEDARARLNVLSETPAEWAVAFAAWHMLNALHRTAVDRQSAPDANDEYLFYQTLIGAWAPELESAPVPAEAGPDLVARVQTHMLKAIKEAKTHTSWFNQNAAYEDAVSRFVRSTLTGPGARDFLPAFVPFARRIAAAGMINSLAQLVLKIGSPGIPDFYQGTECWQLDMADPDNRRPVDFERRAEMLGELSGWLNDRSGCVHTLLANWPDARIKMFVMACGLRLRQGDPGLFLNGEYVALRAEGARAERLLAFARRSGATTAVFAVPRLIGCHTISTPDFWEDTRLIMPAPDVAVAFQNLFTGAQLRSSGSDGGVPVADIFQTVPVAILVAR